MVEGGGCNAIVGTHYGGIGALISIPFVLAVIHLSEFSSGSIAQATRFFNVLSGVPHCVLPMG